MRKSAAGGSAKQKPAAVADSAVEAATAAADAGAPDPGPGARPDAAPESDAARRRTLPGLPKHRRRAVTRSELMLLFIIIVVVVGVVTLVTSKLALHRDVAAARKIADRTIAAIQDRSGADAYQLGTPSFRSQYTVPDLTKQFTAIQVATLQPPHLIEEDYTDGSAGRNVFFMYEYTALKVPYYVRVSVEHRNGDAWQLANIAGNANESQLLASN